MNKLKPGYVLLGLTVAIGTFGITWVARSQVLDSDVGISPVTYETVSISYGEFPLESHQVHAVRSDGSTVTVNYVKAANGDVYTMRLINDLPALRRTIANEGAETKTTVPIGKALAARVRSDPMHSCGSPMSVNQKTIGGFDVIQQKIQVTVQASTGPSRREIERWLAPNLGCAVLEETTRIEGQLKSTQLVQNIRVGEPDSALFAVPAEYAEASLEEVQRRLHDRYGGPEFNADGPIETLLSKAYAERQAELHRQ